MAVVKGTCASTAADGTSEGQIKHENMVDGINSARLASWTSSSISHLSNLLSGRLNFAAASPSLSKKQKQQQIKSRRQSSSQILAEAHRCCHISHNESTMQLKSYSVGSTKASIATDKSRCHAGICTSEWWKTSCDFFGISFYLHCRDQALSPNSTESPFFDGFRNFRNSSNSNRKMSYQIKEHSLTNYCKFFSV